MLWIGLDWSLPMRHLTFLFAASLLFAFVACGDDGSVGSGGDTSSGLDTSGGEDASSGGDGAVNDQLAWDDTGVDAQGDGATDPDGQVLPDTNPGDTNPDQVDPDAPDAPDTTGGNFYPSKELYLKITGPSAGDAIGSLSAMEAVGGVVFGEYDAITWVNETNGTSGTATGAPFWKSGVIHLAQGDNTIRATATKGDQTSSDALVITHNPGFRWDKPLTLRPPSLFVGYSVEVIVTASMGFYSNFNTNSVKLIQVDELGQTIKELGVMRDDGGTNTTSNSGDEYPSDGVFTVKATFSSSEPTVIHLRATAQVTAGANVYTAYSEVVQLPILPHLTGSDCQAMVGLTNDTHMTYDNLLQQGMDTKGARDEIVTRLQADALIAEVGPSSDDGNGVWVRYANGVLGGFSFPTPGTRGAEPEEEPELETITAPLGGPTLGSKRVTLMSPFSDKFVGTDESIEFASRMSSTQCPPFAVDGPLNGGGANLDVMMGMSGSGVVSIVTHGDALFQELSPAARQAYGWEYDHSIEVLWSGESPACELLQASKKTCSVGQGQSIENACGAGATCLATNTSGSSVTGICYDHRQADLVSGRLVFGKTYGVTPGYIQHHAAPSYPNTMVYLGACRSLWNGTLAAAFFAGGAKTVFGFSDHVTSSFAYQKAQELVETLLVGLEDTGGAFEPGQTDPQYPSSAFSMFGANNLDVNDANIVNPSFELGNLTGWTPGGDGRVISKLGATIPVAGKFMGVVSSGMGYTLEVGTIRQKFCIPTDANTVQMYWNYFSEEFHEFCGTGYQDPFTASLEGSGGAITLVDVTVDALCPPNECSGCGTQYAGTYQSDVSFDQGDVWNTRWLKIKKNVSQLSGLGQPVDLKFFVTDEGDTIYDTVILIDDIRFFTE
jgi:hypothetical protein